MTEENRKDPSKQPDIGRNFIYRMIYEIMLYAIPVVMVPYVSRILGAGGVGDYSFSYSVVSYFMMLGALGTVSYGTREVARVRDRKDELTRIFWGIEILSMMTCLISLGAWGAVILLSGIHRPFFIALTPFILGTMFDISWFYTGMERIGTMVLANGAVRIAGVISVFLFVRTGDDAVTYCLICSLTVLGANLLLWLPLPGYLSGFLLPVRDLGHHFRETLVYFVPTIALSVYLVLDKTLIGLITRDSYENGCYEQASLITNIAKALSFSVYGSVISARLSYLFASEKYEEIRARISGALDFIMFMVWGMVFGLLGICRSFVPVFLGPGYGPAETLVYMMLPLIPIVAVSNILGSMYYTPAGKRARSAVFIVAGAAANLVLNICLIPRWGAKGAVAASVAAELLITILYLRNCDGYMSAGMIGRASVKRLAAGAIMASAVWLLGMLPGNAAGMLVIRVISGAVIYCGILALMKDGMVTGLSGRMIRRMKGTERK